MNNFGEYLTIDQALTHSNEYTWEELEAMARDTSECVNCSNPVWRKVGLGLCFTCVTGEVDASDDYELELLP